MIVGHAKLAALLARLSQASVDDAMGQRVS